jgi:LacI family transcriptional regulator
MSNTEAYEAVRALLAGSRDFTRDFGSVSMPFGCLRALTEQGTHVPNDRSMIGFDDIEFVQYTTPPLTTMRQDRDAIGRGALQQLVAMVEGTEEATPLIVPTQLVVRKSTGPAPEEVR